MAKYKQNKKDRMDESRGMKKYYREQKMREERPMREDRRREMRGDMYEDHTAPANLPQYVRHEYYPRGFYEMHYYLDDSAKGLDEYARDNQSKLERESNKPYGRS